MAGLAGSPVDKALFHLPRLVLAALFFLANNLRAEDVLLTVNVKKPAALTSDKFLSYTLDPTVVLTGDALTDNPERSVNMAKALAPAYVRIGGPRSNSYTFERPHRQQDEQDPSFTFTEADWIVVHRWAENAGLDVLACIAPQHSESGGRDPGWDSRNALDLISFSDHMGFNTSWQLGYECQTRCDASGVDIGRDVMRLRSMLDAFPRYSRSVITGPDVVTYRTKQQQQYLQDYLSVAGTALSAITWHPDFASITLDPEGVSLHHDNLAPDRDGLYRVVGRLISKKPLWLAESKPEECKKQFLGALVWTRRLGNAAKLGVQVLMRQPIDSNLIQPTPDYWVSVLHKSLVGREVLDTKIATGNRTHVHFYCQCTKPSAKYEKGSLTIFGINLTPSKVVANLKGVKIKTLHKYILLPGFDAENRMFSETVLLNNEPLNLLNERELPEIKPTISSNSKGVALKLPSGGIGFWVIPGLKIKSCGGLEEDNTDKMLLKKLTKRLEETESDEDTVHEEEQEEEDDEENPSAEERRFSPKSSKNKRRRKHRYSEEDDAEKRYRKLEARMDLERLEKLLRRRDSHDDRKPPRGRTAYFGFEEKSQEKIDDDNAETSEEIRAKLEEYKNRLKEHESRKKVDTRSRGKMAETQDHETIDSDKVVEALTLISKMENAMKILDKSGDEDAPIETLNPGNTYDVTSGLVSPSKSDNPEDMFLDELLKSEKIKRTSVPSKIEDQLRAIYQMLAEEKVRRQRNLEAPEISEITKLTDAQTFGGALHEIDETLSRARRDTDKKFGEDPLGLRKEGLFRRRVKNDDARERRMDRRRRKEKDDRKDGQPVIFDPRAAGDSNENNFYGFQQREPLKGFPEGDVFMTTGTSSEETAKDYDYVADDDDDDGQEHERPRKIPRSGGTAMSQAEPDDATWVEEENTELSHVPKEFFEDVKMAVPRVHENLKEYGELWEAESLGQEQNPQDHLDAEDEEGVGKVVQERRPDAHDDKRAKETAVRKLIGYYDDPRSRQEEEEEEEADYMDMEKLDKPRNPVRNSPRASVQPSETRNQRPVQGHQRNPATAMSKKRVKNLASAEFGAFTDYDSMHFGRAAISSAEHDALGIYKPAARSSPRGKRSTEDLERILNEEMIFQDDNNLKDCECRVNRGTARRRSDRAERRRRPDRRYREDRGDRGRFRNREKPPTTMPGGRFDEDYMHTTRTRRQAVSSSEEVEDALGEDNAESIEDSGSESAAVEEETGSARVSGETSGGEEDISGEDDFVAAPANPVVEDAKAEPAGEDSETSTLGDEGDKLAVEGNHLDEEKELDAEEDAKDEAATNEDVGLAVENEAQDFETDNKVKRHNEENDAAESSQESAGKTEAEQDLKIGDSQIVAEHSTPVEPGLMSANDSEADRFFLASPHEDPATKSKTADEASQANLPRGNLGLREPPEDLQTSSAEDKQSAVGLRSVGADEKTEDSSAAAAAVADEVLQAENGSSESRPHVDSEAAAARDLLEVPRALNPNNEAGNEDGAAAENRVKLEVKETSAETTTQTIIRSSSGKQVSKPSKAPKESARAPRKTSQKTKPVIKIVDPAKVREARLAARSEALQALRKENESKKAKKSLETATRMLTNEQARFQSMQKKRAEQLEKLRDKLRTKRAKIVQEYRDELIGELDKASDEERNIKRREIIEMIGNDEELREIVDQEKFDYLMQNKPINYESVRVESPSEDAEERTKYVPEMVEILRPLHETRERKVRERGQPIRHRTDPWILAFSVPEEATNSDAIRRSLREDSTDHKVERRAGKSYYSVVESLENPKIHYTSDEESGEEDSREVPESSELGQALSSSVAMTESREMVDAISIEGGETDEDDTHYGDYRRRHAISESLEEKRKSSDHPARLARNALGNKNQYMCLKEDSEEESIEDQDELFKLVKENDHYMAVPVLEEKTSDKSSNKEKSVSKKKYLKDSDYEQTSKYKTPKYARLAPEKIEAVRRANLQAPQTNVENNRPKTVRNFDDEDTLQEIVRKNSRRRTNAGYAEDELYATQRKRSDAAQVKSELEVIDDLDLDEALNSSKYELLMLIPVKNQKRSRQRRQVGNKLLRDDENSASNEIPAGIIGSFNEDLSGNKNIEDITVTDMDDSDESSRTASDPKDFADNDDPEDSSVVASTIILEKSTSSTEQEAKMLDGYAVEEIVRSAPETIDHKPVDDEGLPGLIAEAIPKLEATLTGGLGKARHISESFEKFIDGFDEKFRQKQEDVETQRPDSIEATNLQNDSPISSDIFSSTISSVKNFFDFLAGMVHIIRFD